jgi:hypothetical protein
MSNTADIINRFSEGQTTPEENSLVMALLNRAAIKTEAFLEALKTITQDNTSN